MKIILLALLILPLTGCFEKKQEVMDISQLEIISQNNVNHLFKVELALTQKQQMHGLMNRTHMDENAGMLFLFQNEEPRNFWMKNTLIPLDMLFIQRNGIISHIHEKAIPEDLTSVSSNGSVIAVLELNGGIVEKLGISEGDIVKHTFFSTK